MRPKIPQVYFQDSFRSRFIRMDVPAPSRLVELACESLLKNEAMAIASLEMLPTELFPPLFTAAFSGRHTGILKAMVQAWPFACLPLGVLLKEQLPHQENFQAALEGLDALLAQKVRPRRWKLQVLDLRKNAHQDFWNVWSGNRISMYSMFEPEVAQPMKKLKARDSKAESVQPFTPVEVLIDLCLKEGTPDESLTYLLKKVKQRRGALRLCCRKLKIFEMPMQNIKKILKMVRMDSVQELDVNCTWKLPTLVKFASHLGQMSNLRSLRLSHIRMPSHSTRAKEEQCVSQFTSQFLCLEQLQELYFDSISFLNDRLDQVLRCLKTPLETLSITNCLISETDLVHLSQSQIVSQLKDLGLSGVNLTCVNPEPLQVLIERASGTLQDLDLDECGIMDAQLTSILPALSRCSQLTTFSFCGNPTSMVVVKDLLRHTIGLSKLSHVLYPTPLESYEDVRGTLDLGRLAQLHAKLKQMMQELGRPGMVWFSANPCPRCGDRTFYDPDPILCPCYMSA
ncbi:melanoma antigen preferentially expressed in tumors-like [Sorex fumeus]|uniref:melanoma antigen preferentially expressed in tumors-like n=1 Tax=Sorex fumeus TaxID=62283 RepID=UPI0024ACCFA2|nr:melanoma antigen preferentially expressed in tumors-like [Sorex fumeus]